MKLLTLSLVLLTGLIGLGPVHAQDTKEVMYIDRPAWLGDQANDVVDCTVNDKLHNQIGFLCGHPLTHDQTTKVRLGYVDGSDTWVEWAQPWGNRFTCQGGYCVDQYDRMVGVDNSNGGHSTGRLLTGYYVVFDAERDATLYRFETGPYASEFPDFYYHSEATATSQAGPWELGVIGETREGYPIYNLEECTVNNCFSDNEEFIYSGEDLFNLGLSAVAEAHQSTYHCAGEYDLICYDNQGRFVGTTWIWEGQ